MTIALQLPPETSLSLESARWVRLCQRRPDLDGAGGRELLEQAQTWPMNLRLARDAAGVMLVADDYCDALDGELGQPEARLLCWLNGEQNDAAKPQAEEELIESLLTEAVPAFTRREDAWIMPAADDQPVEVRINRTESGLAVKASLADLAEAAPVSREAIGEFLCRAHQALRFVRAELDERSAWVVARAETERLESDLLHAQRAVSTAARLLVRETQALLKPELAEVYLNSVVPK